MLTTNNYVQARRVCYFLWLLAALLSAPTLVARVYVEVFKRQRLTLIQRRTLKQSHISFLLTLGNIALIFFSTGGRKSNSLLVYSGLGQTLAVEVIYFCSSLVIFFGISGPMALCECFEMQ